MQLAIADHKYLWLGSIIMPSTRKSSPLHTYHMIYMYMHRAFLSRMKRTNGIDHIKEHTFYHTFKKHVYKVCTLTVSMELLYCTHVYDNVHVIVDNIIINPSRQASTHTE